MSDDTPTPTPETDLAVAAGEAVTELQSFAGELVGPTSYPDRALVADAIDHAAAALEPFKVGDHTIARLVPPDYSVDLIDERDHEDQPRFKAGAFGFVGASFAEYVARHQQPGATTLHAVDITDPVRMLVEPTVAMAAVLDDHKERQSPHRAGRRQHRARLVLRPSVEARRWGAMLGQRIGQEDLLDLVTDGIGEIAEPDGGDLRDLIASLHATRQVDVESVIRTGGEGTIRLTENVKLRGGPSNEITFPESISVVLTPFTFVDMPIQFVIRVKAQLNTATHRVEFVLTAPALEVELLKVLDHVVAEAQAVTGLTAFWRPSADV